MSLRPGGLAGVEITWRERGKGEREPRGLREEDRPSSRLPEPDPGLPTEIYLQGCFKPLVSISPNSR